MICETCKGTGTMMFNGHIHYANQPHEWVQNKPTRCSECEGTGDISEVTARCKRIGRFVKDGRLALDLTMREAARVNGWDLMYQNDIEWGRRSHERWNRSLR